MYPIIKRTIATFAVTGALAALLTTTSVAAAPIEFDVADAPMSSVTATLGSSLCLGCFVSTALDTHLDALTFALHEGESRTFDFFKIRVGGFGGALVDVSATLGFDAPSGAGASGSGDGGFATILGKVSGGFLHWDDLPYVITLVDGSQFSVDFSDVSGFTLGNSAQDTATVTALKEGSDGNEVPIPEGASTAVPEPGTLALLALGILGVSRARRIVFRG